MIWWLAAALAAAALGWGVLVLRRWGRNAERASRPPALAGAALVYRETAFRTDAPIRLVARIDRAYRMSDGTLVLVELKTRWHHRVQSSDVVQLSAQKLALETSTGLPVAPYGYVSTMRPHGRAVLRHHRVALWDAGYLVALASRRHAVLGGQVQARGAESAHACDTCAFRSVCSLRGRVGRR